MRADIYLVKAGLADSREKAKKLIESRAVFRGGRAITKPSAEISEFDDVRVIADDKDAYVGRGAEKIAAAFALCSLSVEGQVAIDVGASTGGFTDFMLRHGAAKVYAVDAGSGQLSPKLLADPRVLSMEKYNARYLRSEDFSPRPTFATMDVSFISQTLILSALYSVLDDHAVLVSLIKPQFEAGRAAVGKGGIVKDAKDREFAIRRVLNAAETCGFSLCGLCASPILGGDGNREYLAVFSKGKTALSSISDVESAIDSCFSEDCT